MRLRRLHVPVRPLALAAGLAGLLVPAVPAWADTAIAYAMTNGYVGACMATIADEANACAVSACRGAGGEGCEPVLLCAAGLWSAIASPEEEPGIGAACAARAADARRQALRRCIAATGLRCLTDKTLSEDGQPDPEPEDNAAFDLGWYTRFGLAYAGYDAGGLGSLLDGPADGGVGPRVRAAIRSFQDSSGLDPTGEPGWPLVAALIEAGGGWAALADDMRMAVDGEGDRPGLAFAYMPPPPPERDPALFRGIGIAVAGPGTLLASGDFVEGCRTVSVSTDRATWVPATPFDIAMPPGLALLSFDPAALTVRTPLPLAEPLAPGGTIYIVGNGAGPGDADMDLSAGRVVTDPGPLLAAPAMPDRTGGPAVDGGGRLVGWAVPESWADPTDPPQEAVYRVVPGETIEALVAAAGRTMPHEAGGALPAAGLIDRLRRASFHLRCTW